MPRGNPEAPKGDRSTPGRKAEDVLRNRIIGEGDEDPAQLLANPLNWRAHPTRQREALEGVLKEVGWVQRVIVNRRTGHVVDGHLRVEVALKRAEPSVPVLYVDLTEAEERLVLAVLDPIGGLATTDAERLEALLHEVTTADAALMGLLDDLAQQANIVPGDDPEPPDDFGEVDEDIPTEHECPKCGFKWSGKSA